MAIDANHSNRVPRPGDARDLIMLFSDCFREEFNTVLVAGDDEPEYRPADRHCETNRVIFAHGYFASALHEVSHWCIAGARRRKLFDYGYWYAPDGRTSGQQAEFETVEIRPQAQEWIFSVAAGSSFHLSLDNLNGGGGSDYSRFRQAVWQETHRMLKEGMPPRGARFRDALLRFYGRESLFDPERFALDILR